MKIAIAHDYLHTYGGAERVLIALHEAYPDAPIYTSVYYKDVFPVEMQTWDIRTSFLQKFPKRFYKSFKILYPIAFLSFNFNKYDLIISSTAGMAKGINKPHNAIHISYIHTVPRAIINVDNRKGVINAIISKCYKSYDLFIAKKVDYFIANSQVVHDRILKFYNSESVIINPPVEIDKLKSHINQPHPADYFVMIGRLEKYKGTLQVAQVIKKLNLKLKVIGIGPESAEILTYGDNIEYLGGVDDAIKANILYNSLSLIFWAFEDFGITIAESISLGVPVIAYAKGGSIEILNDTNSVLFKDQTMYSLEKALNEFKSRSFDRKSIMKDGLRFSKENFISQTKAFVESKTI